MTDTERKERRRREIEHIRNRISEMQIEVQLVRERLNELKREVEGELK